MRSAEELLEALKSRIIVADGAFGTELYNRGIPPTVCYDSLNLLNPGVVTEIHNQYLSAGAELMETNTFGANRNKLGRYQLADRAREINRRGAEIALSCAGGAAWVAGSMGPLGRAEDGELSDEERKAAFREQAEGLVEGGVEIVILETFSSLRELLIALDAVVQIGNVTAIAQLMFNRAGKTAEGDDALYSLLTLRQRGAAVVGANCGVGPGGTLEVMRAAAKRIDGYVSAFPNAGFPEKVDDRMLYLAGSQYIAQTAVKLVEAGVNIVGGCCGTTPQDIRAIARAVSSMSPVAKSPLALTEVVRERQKKPVSAASITPGYLRDRLKTKKVISVELDPPKGLAYERVIEGARALREVGADVISIAENPLAIPRMSNTTLSLLIQREAGIETIVHITGRDRNLIGLQSTLMGLAVEGVKNILAVTGDPPSGDKDSKVKGVYDVGSLDLISLIARLNRGENYYGEDIKKRTAFTIGAAFNPNSQNLPLQVDRMKRKIERGAEFFQTQPVFSRERIDAMLTATKEIGVPILVGMLPLVSHRNAEFLHNEFPGIIIPDEVRGRMARAGDRGIEEGIEITFDLIRYAYPHVAGIYIMPPFNKYEIARDLISRLRAVYPSSGSLPTRPSG